MGIVDRRCGFGPLKTNARLQRFASLAWYALVAGLIVLGVTASYSYMSSVQSTSQTVFSFSSMDIGIWYAMFEVGSVLSNVLASYFLTNKHIPNILTIGLSLVVVGCLLHGLPHFFIDYEDKVKSTEVISAADHILEYLYQSSNCSSDLVITTEAWEEEGSRNVGITVVYCIAGFLMGLGYAPFWCLGLVYIDDNVEYVHDSTKYVAVILAFYTIGPVVGFGAGGLFLDQYVTLGETYLTPNNTQWIGAYWIGYILFGIILLLLLPVMFMFPKRLPAPVKGGVNVNTKKASTTSAASNRELTDAEYVNGIDDHDGTPEAPDVRDNYRSAKALLPTLGRLLINPLYMLEVIASCTGVYYLSGWIGFLPKYFEVEFNYSASLSSIYAGALPPMFSCVAVFVGGWLTSKYKLNTQKNAMLLFVTSVASTAFMIPMFFLTCDQFPVQEPPINATSCVRSCDCDPNAYVPVCYQGNTYKSPCVVGCDDYIQIDENEIRYIGCLCEQNVTMADGVCHEQNCVSPYIYMVCAVFSMASFLCSASAGVNIIMRSVKEEDKSLALGIQSSLNSLLAWIPSPILYGVLIDSTCNIWEYPGNPVWQGYCMEYSNIDFTHKYLGMTMGVLALTCLFCGLAIPVSYMDRYMDNSEDSDGDSSADANDVKLGKI